jgi:hypothetical protein
VSYQFPGLALLSSALIACMVTLATPRDRLWMVTSVAAAMVTLGMVAGYISLSA